MKNIVPNAALAVVSLLLLSGASAEAKEPAAKPQQRAPRRAPHDSMHQQADGLKVTPREAETNDVADIMGISIWKFKLEAPRPDITLSYSLELRQAGKVIERRGGSASPLSATREEGDWDYYADIEVMVAMHREKDSWNSFVRFAGGSAPSDAMALKGLNLQGWQLAPELQKDGSFELARFGLGNSTPADKQIVLVMTFQITKAK